MIPAFSAASIIARPMRSLTLEYGLKNSSFKSTVACSGGNHAVEFDQRRIERGLDDVRIDFGSRHGIILFLSGH